MMNRYAVLSRRGFKVDPNVSSAIGEPCTASKNRSATRGCRCTVYGGNWELHQLAEKLVDLEDAFRQWRFRHATTVERIIGLKRGTGGTSGVGYLRRVLDVEFFPEPWRAHRARDERDRAQVRHRSRSGSGSRRPASRAPTRTARKCEASTSIRPNEPSRAARWRFAAREGRRWVQTLKAGRSGTGGAAPARRMGARAPGRLDLSLLGDTPLARMQDAANIGEKLAPIFEVNFTPHRLDVLAGARLQARVALDSGGGREAAGSTPTSEVEIECLEGDPAARSTSRSAG